MKYKEKSIKFYDIIIDICDNKHFTLTCTLKNRVVICLKTKINEDKLIYLQMNGCGKINFYTSDQSSLRNI